MVSPPSSITSAELLSILKRDELLLTRDPATGEQKQTIAGHLYRIHAERYRKVLEEHGGITDRRSMRDLCKKLHNIDEELGGLSLNDVPEDILEREAACMQEKPIDAHAALEEQFQPTLERVRQRVQRARAELRVLLERRVGWRKQPLRHRGRTTAEGVRILNRVRRAANLPEHKIDGNQYLSPEELEMSIAIAAGIGDAALADFWAYIAPERFSYNNRTWQTLRQWVGEAEMTYTGTVIEDIPEALLIRPPLAALRELLKNQKIDQLHREHYRGSVSVDPVLEEIIRMQEHVTQKADEERRKAAEGSGKPLPDIERERDARLRFLDELTDFFIETESLLAQRPARIKGSLNGNGEPFPAPHQLIAIMKIRKLRQILIADEVGAGKTAEAIGGFEYLREWEPEEDEESHREKAEQRVQKAVASFEILRQKGEASKALIICPNDVVVGVWKERFSKYFEEQPPYVVIDSSDPPQTRGQKWLRAKKQAEYVLMNIDMTGAQSVIEDEEFARELGIVPGARVSHELLAQNIGADFLVIDEGQSIRNIEGVQHEAVFRISQCESIRRGFTVILTATPIYNKMDDLAAFIRLLNAGHQRGGDAATLPQDVDLTDIQSISQAVRTNNTRLVRNLLFLRMLRRETRDCLPTGVECHEEAPNRRPFDSPLEREDYDVLVEDPWDLILPKIGALKRKCAHGGDECRRSGIASCTKYNQVKEQVLADREMLRAQGRPGPYRIFLCIYEHASFAKGITRDFSEENDGNGTHDPEKCRSSEFVAGQLREDLAKEGIRVYIIDGMNSKEAPAILERCRESSEDLVLIARTSIIGEGDDLSFMDTMRSFTPTTVPGERTQAIGRVNRIGRTQPLTYGDCMIADTIEEGMYRLERCKRRAGEDLLRGAPLSQDEIELLEESMREIKRGKGFLAYESKTPLQRIMHIFNLMFRAGKDRAQETLSLDNRRYARELAQYYADYEEVTLPGNNRRAILALLQKHLPDLHERLQAERIRIADIASGPMALARSLAHERDMDVFSSDLAEEMIAMGQLLMEQSAGHRVPEDRADTCAMDEIEYKSESMHVVVHSLSLQYAKHDYKERENGGDELIRSLCKVNEVLITGGIAFLALPVGIFYEPQKFRAVCSVLRTHFGFEVIEEDSGHMQTIPGKDEPLYESYIFTLRKVGAPNVIGMSPEAWKILRFSHQVPTRVSGKEKPVLKNVEEVHPTEGSYSEDFVLGTQRLHYDTPEELSQAKREHQEEVAECEKAKRRIEALLRKHNTRSFYKIPPEELLSFTLEEVDDVGQQALDAYMHALMDEYDGDLYAIPLEKLNAHSTVHLKLNSTTKRGPFIYIARLGGRKRKRGRKRYFYEQEF